MDITQLILDVHAEVDHITGVRPVNKDPDAYIEANG